MTLLDVQNLSIDYHVLDGIYNAVSRVSFSLEKGKSLGLVGESGCGKTTIAMALMGLLPQNGVIKQGRIYFEGRDLSALSDEEIRNVRWKEIAMIFQAAMNALNPVHPVGDQIVEAIMTHQPLLSKQEAFSQVESLFELVDLPKERIKHYPHQYSGGMKQRAVIAMALACRPKLIIADEPTTALDVIVQDQILKEIQNLQQTLDISIIFISHDIAVVAETAHHIGIMFAGKLVEYGPKEAVLESPQHPYTQALLSSYPKLTGPRGRLTALPLETDRPMETGCRFFGRCSQKHGDCEGGPPEWADITSTHKVLCHKCS